MKVLGLGFLLPCWMPSYVVWLFHCVFWKKIIETFSSVVDSIIETSTMTDAVRNAYKIAKPNEIVLLSPACSSFDLFKDYEDRGNQFKEQVRNL